MVVTTAALAVGIALLSAPHTAQAAFQQYALSFPIKESVAKYSAVATVSGGQAQLAVSNVPRTYIQTLSGGVLVASSFADAGGLANLSHAIYASAQSRCYWDWLPGTIPGNPSININCWRRY